MKTEEREDCEHDNDEADKIDDTVHGTFLHGCPTSRNP
jgi:hypothetical protein